MLEHVPASAALLDLVGRPRYDLYMQLVQFLRESYDMQEIWNPGGKAWVYEHKFRRGGRTLCGLYFRAGTLGCMVILGKAEREKFMARREDYSPSVCKLYDGTKTYRDGKWLMVDVRAPQDALDCQALIRLKRKPAASPSADATKEIAVQKERG